MTEADLLKTTDLCDAHEAEIGSGLHVLAPLFRAYGRKAAFSGQIVTLKLFEDNSLVRELLGEPGAGRVLVVDGGGSLRCALVGDQLALLAQKNGWAGIVVNGCIRDSADIQQMDIGIRALNTHPQKSIKRGVGDRDVAVTFAGVRMHPGDWLYADHDGMLVSGKPLHQAGA